MLCFLCKSLGVRDHTKQMGSQLSLVWFKAIFPECLSSRLEKTSSGLPLKLCSHEANNTKFTGPEGAGHTVAIKCAFGWGGGKILVLDVAPNTSVDFYPSLSTSKCISSPGRRHQCQYQDQCPQAPISVLCIFILANVACLRSFLLSYTQIMSFMDTKFSLHKKEWKHLKIVDSSNCLGAQSLVLCISCRLHSWSYPASYSHKIHKTKFLH